MSLTACEIIRKRMFVVSALLQATFTLGSLYFVFL